MLPKCPGGMPAALTVVMPNSNRLLLLLLLWLLRLPVLRLCSCVLLLLLPIHRWMYLLLLLLTLVPLSNKLLPSFLLNHLFIIVLVFIPLPLSLQQPAQGHNNVCQRGPRGTHDLD